MRPPWGPKGPNGELMANYFISHLPRSSNAVAFTRPTLRIRAAALVAVRGKPIYCLTKRYSTRFWWLPFDRAAGKQDTDTSALIEITLHVLHET